MEIRNSLKSRAETRQDTHRSLATGGPFVLTELATCGCNAHHLPGEVHQLLRGQLRDSSCIRDEKPKRSIFTKSSCALFCFVLPPSPSLVLMQLRDFCSASRSLCPSFPRHRYVDCSADCFFPTSALPLISTVNFRFWNLNRPRAEWIPPLQ